MTFPQALHLYTPLIQSLPVLALVTVFACILVKMKVEVVGVVETKEPEC